MLEDRERMLDLIKSKPGPTLHGPGALCSLCFDVFPGRCVLPDALQTANGICAGIFM